MSAKKVQTAWFCSNCGAESTKWQGRCPACGEWNTLVEEKVAVSGKTKSLSPSRNRNNRPVAVSEIETADLPRIPMPSHELNRVLGGGLVPGSLVLIGGEPGIGKSTLVL
ncbi:MAG: DNA repair protein RadA, partial [Duncaniella sp.]|nr:DNA repair protein RadA [Duncaniella sp.]